MMQLQLQQELQYTGNISYENDKSSFNKISILFSDFIRVGNQSNTIPIHHKDLAMIIIKIFRKE